MNRRITLSLPEELVDEALAATEAGRASSVSAYVAAALREKSGRYSLAEVLDQLDAEFGPVSTEALESAKRELDQAVAAKREASTSAPAYAVEALREKSGRYSLADVLDQLDAEFGPVPREAAEWAKREADRVLGVDPRKD